MDRNRGIGKEGQGRKHREKVMDRDRGRQTRSGNDE